MHNESRMVAFFISELNLLKLSSVSYILFCLVSCAGQQSSHNIGQQSNLPGPDQLKYDISFCSRVDCHHYASCLVCSFPPNCKYNAETKANCTTNKMCMQQFTIEPKTTCKFCWQSDPEDHACQIVRNCSTTSVGRRSFYKNVRCNWTNGYSWWKAMFLSVTLGGFGVDRFYLGLWKSAIGKLFSFGGLGIWTIVDIILIGVGYVGPADNSAYI
uniref:TM2 domain-containing protein n=1 Tax=Acrobeloides nanus TaxID=290746 RepID=A0A914C5G9_9BILA